MSDLGSPYDITSVIGAQRSWQADTELTGPQLDRGRVVWRELARPDLDGPQAERRNMGHVRLAMTGRPRKTSPGNITAARIGSPSTNGRLVALMMVVTAALAPLSTNATGQHARYVLRVEAKSVDAVIRRVRAVGGRVSKRLDSVGMLVSDLPAGASGLLAGEPGVASITADTGVRLESSSYDPKSDGYSVYNDAAAIGARSAWKSHISGEGIDVALLDSGVARVAGLDGTDKVVDGPDLSFDSQNPQLMHRDAFGHGTHLAGIIAGHDAGVDPSSSPSNSSGFLGVAPDARIVNVKVADAFGATDVSQVIAGIDWVVQHAHDPGLNIRILNLSFGTDSAQRYQSDPLAYAAEVAWAAGIVVVVSAGNDGTTAGRLSDPAVDPFVLAVGAADTNATKNTADDTVPDYSSRGDGERNPDLVAPGQHVGSLRVPGSYVDQQFGGGPGSMSDRILRGSGTSQAAAMASGAAALLLQRRPWLTPDQVKSVLMSTATPLAATDPTASGSGLINVKGALLAQPARSPQPWASSTGGGSLEGARGAEDLVLANVALTGEQDIFGRPFDSGQHAALEAIGATWTGGEWNNGTWSGDGWQSFAWLGTTWTSPSWAGTCWTGPSWDSADWNGLSWDNASWTGVSWDTSRWSGSSWDGLSWDMFDWS